MYFAFLASQKLFLESLGASKDFKVSSSFSIQRFRAAPYFLDRLVVSPEITGSFGPQHLDARLKKPHKILPIECNDNKLGVD